MSADKNDEFKDALAAVKRRNESVQAERDQASDEATRKHQELEAQVHTATTVCEERLKEYKALCDEAGVSATIDPKPSRHSLTGHAIREYEPLYGQNLLSLVVSGAKGTFAIRILRVDDPPLIALCHERVRAGSYSLDAFTFHPRSIEGVRGDVYKNLKDAFDWILHSLA